MTNSDKPIIQSAAQIEADALGAALRSISDSVRGAGLAVFVAGPTGDILASAGDDSPLFGKFLFPSLSADRPAGRRLREHIVRAGPQSGLTVCEILPGFRLAVAPVADRRQIRCALILAGAADESANHETLAPYCAEACATIEWFEAEVSRLRRYGRGAITTSATLLHALFAEKLRTLELEGEISSLSVQLANSYEELSLIEQISAGLRVNRRMADFFRQACLDVSEVIGARAMGYALRGEKLHQEPAAFGELNLPREAVNRLADQLFVALRARKTCVVVNDLARSPEFQWLAGHARQLVAVPLVREAGVMGCLFALDKRGREFDSVDVKLMTSIANESAIYLENAMLFSDVHDLMMGMLHSLTSAVDAKDAYTCGHSERVALLSRHLAGMAGLSDHQIDRIYMAGLLHDVGKIGVPESVLQKTGRLTPDEFEQMKKHPQIGARILADVKQMEDIIPGVLHHHERYDGKGYPSGLAGKDIPLMGRIICLADCFDAMTSNRTYRRALPIEVAIMEIRRCAGTQFDPGLAEQFVKISPDQFRLLLADHQQQVRKMLELQQTLRAA